MDSESLIALLLFWSLMSIPAFAVVNASMKLMKSRKYKGKVNGRVISVIKGIDWCSKFYDRYYIATFQYTVNNFTYEKKSDYCHKRKSYSVGDIEEIHYELEHPENFIECKDEYWVKGVKSTVIGLIVYYLTIAVLWWVTRNR